MPIVWYSTTMGRKPLSDVRRRDCELRIRLTVAERFMFYEVAMASESLSDKRGDTSKWAREVLNKAAREQWREIFGRDWTVDFPD